ncbi:MAG: excinuclease ABC subunit UvrC [Rickettsiales bacterium]|nr:excinuclease ABC subunit UvrC [Pseudomonadota bacterium]MDA0967005.1 excinuclease ABC subunit UvrC [Pseudomonadota bacterium]MDG4543925.1 excinuclease ABC subunit UvrC [Rickettsiales bacterium]MDG4546071.1 excinuclease ABC subunit UvrC [Rickettsiales bacterium]MDG4548317.1 excinuclease ABC subunit UvrC [Rickettsiales bacterium]
MTNIKNGIKIIKKHLEAMPTSPGIYKMIDEGGTVLYVGKAKNLAKRVVNYTRPERLEYRIQAMISNVKKVEFITTKTEAEALLLESNLIKKFEPRYNILLKDGKTYPFILIESEKDFPRVVKHRGARKTKGKYYGPFASAGAVNTAISDLQKAFLLRPCSDSYFNNRQRPCLEYQIKRCSAPCVDYISKEEYAILVKQANDFMSGKSRAIQEELVRKMEEESRKFNYEKAAVYRDRIKALNQVQAKQTIGVTTLNDADIIGIANEGGVACIQVFFYRGGQHYGNRSFFPKNTAEQSDSDILNAFLCQYYQDNNIPPKDIIISENIEDKEFLEEFFSDSANYKVRITIPKSGDKKKLLDEANRNAKAALQQKLIGKTRQKDMLRKLAELFNMQSPPKRVEIYDNSHTFGQDQIGAMVVADEEGFNKKAYRRFNIRNKFMKGGDDYAMMEEVLTRRFKRLKMECPDKTAGIWPELVLIDGGAGHLTTVTKVFDSLGLTDDLTFVCISKGVDRNAGKEQFHMLGRDSFTLPKTDPAMYFLQVLRDEAHRFAIGSHRNKRAKSVTKSAFDEIPGIGPKRKKILLNHFGSAEDVKAATLEELEQASGIDKKMAEIIYNYFH